MLRLSAALVTVVLATPAAADECREQRNSGRSPASKRASAITFLNSSDSLAEVFWLDFKGKLKSYGTIAPRDSFHQPSFQGHIWILQSDNGACRGVFTVGRNPKTVSVLPAKKGALPVSTRCSVAPIPDSIVVPDFYQKYCMAGGIPILASEEVADAALVAAWGIVTEMTGHLSPPMRESLSRKNVRVAVIGKNQGTADIPEYWRRAERMGAEALNRRARGLGGRLSSAGEENLICLPKDRYRGESILIHEFAHTIWSFGVKPNDGKGLLLKRLNAAFKKAKKKDRLLNLYAGTNTAEYWAEGVQTYFNSNLPSDIPGRESRFRDGLLEHDPELHALIRDVFGEGNVSHCH